MSEWHIIKGANDILICGPGNLIISLREFDRKKVEVIDKDVMGMTTLVSRVRYPLDDKISLELTMLSSGSNSQIKLHVGDRIQWTIPKDVAQSLKNILTSAAVYSQTNVKKSTGVLKTKRKAKAPAKHKKISGRALLQAQDQKVPPQTVETPVALKGKRGRKPALKPENAPHSLPENPEKGIKSKKSALKVPVTSSIVVTPDKPQKPVNSPKNVKSPEKKTEYKSKKPVNLLQALKPQGKAANEKKTSVLTKPEKKTPLKAAKPLSPAKLPLTEKPKSEPKKRAPEKTKKQPKK